MDSLAAHKKYYQRGHKDSIKNSPRGGGAGCSQRGQRFAQLLSETDQTGDLRMITVPTLVMQGDDDQIVP
jgi:non-heme chloroperoxidase